MNRFLENFHEEPKDPSDFEPTKERVTQEEEMKSEEKRAALTEQYKVEFLEPFNEPKLDDFLTILLGERPRYLYVEHRGGDDYGSLGTAWFEARSGLKVKTDKYSEIIDRLAETLRVKPEMLLELKERIGTQLVKTYGADDGIYRISLEDLYPKEEQGLA